MEENNMLEFENNILALFEGLKINIKGLALVYEKNGIANLRCPVETRNNPVAANHKLKLTITSGVIGSERTVSKITIPDGSLVEINNFNFQSPLRSDFTGILNIRAEHSPHPVKFVRNIDDISSHVKINGIRMVGDQNSKHDFETWEIVNHGLTPGETRQRKQDKHDVISAIEGKVTFTDPSAALTVITVKSPKSQPIPGMEIRLIYAIPASPATLIPHTIDIHNLCDEDVADNEAFIECDTKSDFLAYYPLIDHTGFGKKFDFLLIRPQGHRAPCNVTYCDTDPEVF